MANGLLSTIKVMREEIAALAKVQRDEFAHVGTVLLRVLRDLDDIKSQLSVRKADKPRRRAVHPKSEI